MLTMIKYLDKMTEVGLLKERESTDCSTKARPHQTDENALSAMGLRSRRAHTTNHFSCLRERARPVMGRYCHW